jgi:putative SOS response-associated peptidase YedK
MRASARAASFRSPAITNGRTPRAENSRGTFTARDGSPLLTAASLWDEWKNRETGERLKSCAMIVGEPNELAAEIHERMPVFLMEDQFAAWQAGAECLKPAPNDYLQRWPVSKQVNSSKADADDASLIEPARVTVA